MFSFWNRKGNNKSSGQPSQQTEGVELSRAHSKVVHVPQQVNPPERIPAEVAPEPPVPAAPNHHDAAVGEVYAKLLQAEQLASTAHPLPPTDPLTDAARPRNPSPEPFFDPATGEQRGYFEPAAATSGSGDSEQLRDEVWTHLARIRQIQSEIATMHRRMEGVGDGSGALVEVDNDVDVDTVPTQEEEDAAKRAKEFERLPGRFKGRSDNIDAMMAKLNDLSQAMTLFHALQPPSLSFDSAPTSRQTTYPDTLAPAGSRATPFGTARTRAGAPPSTIFESNIILDQKPLHESPITTHDPFSANMP